MINCILGLKQQKLQMNGHGWFHLQGLRQVVRKGNKRKILYEKMSPPGIEPATLGFPAAHLAVGVVAYLRLKLLQYNECVR